MNAWVRDGLAQETRATGPRGNPFKALTLTSKGMAEARKRAAERGMDPGQEIRFARIRPSEAARVKDGQRAADAERHRIAEDLELPVDDGGRVLYPDAQIEYTDADGRSGRTFLKS